MLFRSCAAVRKRIVILGEGVEEKQTVETLVRIILSKVQNVYYFRAAFFLPATVLRRPLRVRELVRVR